MEKRLDSVVSSGEFLCIKTFACINIGRLKTVEKGQNHLNNPAKIKQKYDHFVVVSVSFDRK